jgi:hypothetical protein
MHKPQPTAGKSYQKKKAQMASIMQSSANHPHKKNKTLHFYKKLGTQINNMLYSRHNIINTFFTSKEH